MLNNREIAIGIWLLATFIISLSKRNIRSSLQNFLGAFFSKTSVFILLLMIAYLSSIVFALKLFSLWNIYLLKDTIIWFVFVGAPISYSIFASHDNEKVFSGFLIDNLRFTVLVEFLVNSYTFPLLGELILVPVVTIIFMILGYTSVFRENKNVEDLITKILGFIGLGILIFVLFNLFTNYENIVTYQKLQELLLPLVFSFLFIPFIYIVMLYIAYEKLFRIIGLKNKVDTKIIRYGKRKLFAKLGIKLQRIKKFHQVSGYKIFEINNKEDINKVTDGI